MNLGSKYLRDSEGPRSRMESEELWFYQNDKEAHIDTDRLSKC